MSGEDLHPANKWELPAGILMAGIVILSFGLAQNIKGICFTGLIMVIASAFWIIKIKVRTIDTAMHEEDPNCDPDNMKWKSQSHKFHHRI